MTKTFVLKTEINDDKLIDFSPKEELERAKENGEATFSKTATIMDTFPLLTEEWFIGILKPAFERAQFESSNGAGLHLVRYVLEKMEDGTITGDHLIACMIAMLSQDINKMAEAMQKDPLMALMNKLLSGMEKKLEGEDEC